MRFALAPDSSVVSSNTSSPFGRPATERVEEVSVRRGIDVGSHSGASREHRKFERRRLGCGLGDLISDPLLDVLAERDTAFSRASFRVLEQLVFGRKGSSHTFRAPELNVFARATS